MKLLLRWQIKEVVGLFMVLPENLKGLMEHGFLAQQDRVELWEYIRQRADVRWVGLAEEEDCVRGK